MKSNSNGNRTMDATLPVGLMAARHKTLAGPLICALGLIFLASWMPTHAQPPGKLQLQRWSGDINVPDPVAVSVDDQGRVFVTQTRRRKIQDLDIRQHTDWIADDVGLTSVEEKRAFLKAMLAIDGDQQLQSRHVKDLNQDGAHDWRDLTVVSEAIYRLVDEDDDGRADEISTFAEGFNTEVTGIAAGVLAHEGDVYATIAPDVWRLTDKDHDGLADSREVVAHGFGLHIAYAGHDMHGLTVGPDGKIYWTIGDKGINVTTKDGRNFRYPHQGGVMRCNPDGSDFEVFAHGLRNVQEIAFDNYGNMFGVDNDSDQPGERERFVWIVEGMDAGWRCYYQYRGESYNPWTAERLWQVPDQNMLQEGHPAYIVPPLDYSIDGPAGFVFNPGTALSEDYGDYFFMTGAPNGNQLAFRIELAGEAFRKVKEHPIGSGTAIVGLAFGPDGCLYGADWDGGYPLDQKGSVVRFDVADQANRHPLREEVRQLLANGFADLEKVRLLGLLSHADQRVRLGSQFELVRRRSFQELSALALSENASLLGRLHALWGCGQLARQGDLLCRDTLGVLLQSQEDILRAQAAKCYGEISSVDGLPLVKLINDSRPMVRILACLALARHPHSSAASALVERAAKLNREEHYQRHAISAAFASCATDAELEEAVKHESEAVRMVALLAYRSLGSAAMTSLVDDASPWVSIEAIRGIHDTLADEESLERVASLLEPKLQWNEARARRIINANLRLGTKAALKRLVSVAQAAEAVHQVRISCLESLQLWRQPPVLDHVQGIRREYSGSRFWSADLVAPLLSELATGADKELRRRAIAAATALQVDLSLDTLQSIVQDPSVDSQTRVQALSSLNGRYEQIVLAAINAEDDSLRIKALELMSSAAGVASQVALDELVSNGPIAVRQAAIASLDVSDEQGVATLRSLVKQMLADSIPRELHMEIWNAFQKYEPQFSDASSLRKQVEQKMVGSLPSGLEQYAFSGAGGDVAKGQKIFRSHLQAQCARCHRIGPTGSNIGPELSKIGKLRDAKHLLTSIVAPSAEIEAKYRTQIFLLASGNVVQGVIESEDEEEITVVDATGARIKVSVDDIEDSKEQTVSLMPEMVKLLTPSEVRDLVAYLQSLR